MKTKILLARLNAELIVLGRIASVFKAGAKVVNLGAGVVEKACGSESFRKSVLDSVEEVCDLIESSVEKVKVQQEELLGWEISMFLKSIKDFNSEYKEAEAEARAAQKKAAEEEGAIWKAKMEEHAQAEPEPEPQ